MGSPPSVSKPPELFDINVSQSLIVDRLNKERIHMDRQFEHGAIYEKPKGDKRFGDRSKELSN